MIKNSYIKSRRKEMLKSAMKIKLIIKRDKLKLIAKMFK